MKNFVNQLPLNSPHLHHIDLGGSNPAQFNLNLGQRGCIRTIFSKIQAVIVNPPSTPPSVQFTPSQSSTTPELTPMPSQPRTGSSSLSKSALNALRASLPDPAFDLHNLQTIVNNKLSQGLALRGYRVEHFPIVASQTSSFPFVITVLCPNCESNVSFQISADVKKTHKVVNFRRYAFIDHFLKCSAEGGDSDDEDEA